MNIKNELYTDLCKDLSKLYKNLSVWAESKGYDKPVNMNNIVIEFDTLYINLTFVAQGYKNNNGNKIITHVFNKKMKKILLDKKISYNVIIWCNNNALENNDNILVYNV